jgi:RNA polymerase sigma-70 factor (ECF subfamily)
MPVGSDTQLHGLVDLVRRGDPRAKSLLLDHARDRLLRLTRRMFRNYPTLRRWEATDDVLQKSLVRLSRALDAVEIESVRHFFNLASTQIRRELLDLKRHYFGACGQGRHHHTDKQAPEEAGGSLHRRTDEPEDLSQWENFHSQVESLSEDLKEVVNLLFYKGLSQEEAADVLGVSQSTIKRRWHEARVRLHETLRDRSG